MLALPAGMPNISDATTVEVNWPVPVDLNQLPVNQQVPLKLRVTGYMPSKSPSMKPPLLLFSV